MRADPGHPAEQHDGEQRNRPDDQLELAGIFPIRQIERPVVGRPEPPGDGEGGDDGRDHDDEHDGDRIDEERRVAVADRAFRIEHRPVAAAEEQGQGQGRQAQTAAAEREPSASSPRPRRAARSSARPLRGQVHAGSLSLSILRWRRPIDVWRHHPGGFVQSRFPRTAHARVRASERLLGSGRFDIRPPWTRAALRSMRWPTRSAPAGFAAMRLDTALPCPTSLGPFSRSRTPRVSASPARRRASGFMPRGALSPIHPASACASGSGSARRYSTIRRRSRSCAMGFCFPGLNAKGGDLPPRRECAQTWRERLFARLPNLELILLVGQYAQSVASRPDCRRQRVDRNGRRMARRLLLRRASAPHADASSLVAQQRLAEAQSLVRIRAVADAAGRRRPQRRAKIRRLERKEAIAPSLGWLTLIRSAASNAAGEETR